MALTKEAVRQLVRLQEEDKKLDALQASIDKIPARVGEIRAEIDGRKSRLAETKVKSGNLQLRKKEKEGDVANKEAAIKKHQTELNQVKTNEAFKALLTEIEKAKAEISDLETEILTIMDDLDGAARDEKKVVAEIAALDSKDQADISALEKEKAELEAKFSAERGKRAALLEGLPADVLRNYEHLRKRRQGTALAPIHKNLCGACRIAIPPQTTVEVMKGQLMTCESCQRILYIQENAEKSASVAPPA